MPRSSIVAFLSVNLASATSFLKRFVMAVVGDFIHLSAFLADHEGDGIVPVAAGWLQATKALRLSSRCTMTELNQLLQCPVDLGRRAKPVVAKLVENSVGAQWLSSTASGRSHNKGLVLASGQRLREHAHS
jgi:hypothetical protein